VTETDAPATPPELLPGRSAFDWAVLTFLLLLLVYVVFIGGGLFVGVPDRTPQERAPIAAAWIVILIITILIWVLGEVEFRAAAYRERSAGYTTMRGDRVEIVLPGRGATPKIPLFPTADLWQLDHKTGAVIRRPTQGRDPWT
jgi:hypothetical protein